MWECVFKENVFNSIDSSNIIKLAWLLTIIETPASPVFFTTHEIYRLFKDLSSVFLKAFFFLKKKTLWSLFKVSSGTDAGTKVSQDSILLLALFFNHIKHLVWCRPSNLNPSMHNVEEWSNIFLKYCYGNTARF